MRKSWSLFGVVVTDQEFIRIGFYVNLIVLYGVVVCAKSWSLFGVVVTDQEFIRIGLWVSDSFLRNCSFCKFWTGNLEFCLDSCFTF